MQDWCVAIVGMNAVGKTSFGKRLAVKLKLKRIDTDAEFTKQFGDIQRYITEHGWEVYRQAEAGIVLEALQPENLVTLGGGAVESPEVRQRLQEQAAVIWLQASPKKVAKHIREAKKPRPEFATGSPDAVAKQLTAERDPLYEAVANIRIRSNVPFKQHLPIAIAELKKFYA